MSASRRSLRGFQVVAEHCLHVNDNPVHLTGRYTGNKRLYGPPAPDHQDLAPGKRQSDKQAMVAEQDDAEEKHAEEEKFFALDRCPLCCNPELPADKRDKGMLLHGEEDDYLVKFSCSACGDKPVCEYCGTTTTCKRLGGKPLTAQSLQGHRAKCKAAQAVITTPVAERIFPYKERITANAFQGRVEDASRIYLNMCWLLKAPDSTGKFRLPLDPELEHRVISPQELLDEYNEVELQELLALTARQVEDMRGRPAYLPAGVAQSAIGKMFCSGK